MGLLNPIFDRQIVTQIGTLAVSGGVVSMLTLVMKGVFCLLASFLLMATTTIEEICRALRQLHLPKTITSLLLLTFRYIGVLLSEVSVMQEAYSLRAPGQKGVHISAWGSFLGQLLLRSMDRAEALYESMELRGFCGDFSYAVRPQRLGRVLAVCDLVPGADAAAAAGQSVRARGLPICLKRGEDDAGF